jgi:serine/threonine protein kinase
LIVTRTRTKGKNELQQLRLENSIVDDRYVVDRCLGRGSFAEIFLATDRRANNRLVIIKALNTSLQGTIDIELERTLTENFQNEALALDKVRHPNIIRRLGHGTAADLDGIAFHYLVLEYMPGGDLLGLCRKRPLTLEDALHYFEQIAAALAHAHSNGVIHRDIKPNNLLLSEDRRTVKIADFGVAKLTSNDAAEITRVGTNVYAPPEHHPDSPTEHLNERLTPSADIYSLAKTVYTAMTGRAPRQFAREPVTDLPSEIINEPWGQRLLALLKRATSTKAKDRYQTVEEFWKDLVAIASAPSPDAEVDPEATLVRSRLSKPMAVEKAAAQPRFESITTSHVEAPRAQKARIIVELPSQPKPPVAQPKHPEGTLPLASKAPPVAAQQVAAASGNKVVVAHPGAVTRANGKTGVVDANTKKIKEGEVVEKGWLDRARSRVKTEWLRIMFIIFLFVALAGLAASTYFHFIEQRYPRGVITGAPNVNLRSEPGLSGVSLAELPTDTRVMVYEKNGMWSRVKVLEWSGTPPANAASEGWVYSKYINIKTD